MATTTYYSNSAEFPISDQTNFLSTEFNLGAVNNEWGLVPHDPTLANIGNGSHTIMFRFKTDVVQLSALWEKLNLIKGSFIWFFGNALIWNISDGVTASNLQAPVLLYDEWQTLTFVYNAISGSDRIMYHNGIEVARETHGFGDWSTVTQMGIAARISGNFPSHGRMDEFALWTAALSDTDVLKLHNNNMATVDYNNGSHYATNGWIKAASLVAWYRCGDGDGNGLWTDNSAVTTNDCNLQNMDMFNYKVDVANG